MLDTPTRPSGATPVAAGATAENRAGASRCDVVVAGGGPAGSTIATLLARRGLAVKLYEKAAHPRFHIGESLLPMNLPIFERLGLSAALAAIGVKKLGADFPAADERGYHTFRFARAMHVAHDHAWQVKREALDQLLFRHAAANGVETREGAKVESVELGADEVVVTVEGGRVHARHFVDATGRDTLLGAQLGLKRRSAAHASAALFAHFTGVERRPGEDAGNISIYRFAHGWVWVIPLAHGITSVGAVCFPDYLKRRRGRNEAFLLETLRGIPALRQRMECAAISGHLHATGNYSYACTRFAGERWTAVGDACAFVDPIFSSGVYLAMAGAERAAELVAASLERPRQRALRDRYEREVRRGLSTFSWFIHRFNSPTMKHLFANPRDTWQLEAALIAMLAGNVESPEVLKRLKLFKLVYYVTALSCWRTHFAAWRAIRRERKAGFDGGTTAQDPR